MGYGTAGMTSGSGEMTKAIYTLDDMDGCADCLVVYRKAKRKCDRHDPVLCSCEEPTPGTGFWREHQCSTCFRLVP